MSDLEKHIEECAHESGVEWPPAYTCQHTVEYKGHNLEVFYDEDGCRWHCFVQGIGTSTGGLAGDEDGAIEAAKKKIDKLAS